MGHSDGGVNTTNRAQNLTGISTIGHGLLMTLRTTHIMSVLCAGGCWHDSGTAAARSSTRFYGNILEYVPARYQVSVTSTVYRKTETPFVYGLKLS